MQWRRQIWGTGARAPWSLRMHAHFAAVQTMAVLIFLASSVLSKLDHQSHQLLWQTVAKKFTIFVFADLTLDGFHFWMTLSPRTSEPVNHVPVPPPLEKNSGDSTDHRNDQSYRRTLVLYTQQRRQQQQQQEALLLQRNRATRYVSSNIMAVF